MAADISLILLVSAIAGAGLNILRGWSNSGENETWSIKKTIGGLIIGIFGALAVIQVVPTEGLGTIGLIVVGLLTGFTSDFAISKSKT